MRISQVTISGFQCFPPHPTEIGLDDLTAVVGSNGSGKSAFLTALCRMFGTNSSLRRIRKSDFHHADPNAVELSLSIELKIDLPELENATADQTPAIPETFNQMVVGETGSTPFCRIRLESTWRQSNTEEGDIEERLFWITTANQDVTDADKRDVTSFERSRIHTIYIPAIREPSQQLKKASGTVLGRMLRMIDWSDGISRTVESASSSVTSAFRAEIGISTIEGSLESNWAKLQNFHRLAKIKLQPIESQFSELMKQLSVYFSDAGESNEVPFELLSEGQRSLFYMTLLITAFDIEDRLTNDPEGTPGFDSGALAMPTLTIFAVEEPENHLAPHFVGRICKAFEEISQKNTVQVVVTSHSSSILKRVQPTQVRHFRSDGSSCVVSKISLPESTDDSYKYVKEAVQAYPELYFSKFVVLCEGDSEEFVLSKFGELFDVSVDGSFVSVVPLGGRYVNHFWRLLSQLQIPHVTLLDLDNERYGGGWGRIKYASKCLESIGVSRDQLYSVTNNGHTKVMDPHEVEVMHDWNVANEATLQPWLERLENHGVFFSNPLDLDFLMLSSFPERYKGTANQGPRIPESGTPEYQSKLNSSLTTTLKPSNLGGDTYTPEQKALFIWYAYLFIGKSKPSTHLSALGSLNEDELGRFCPAVLNRLFTRVNSMLGL